MRKGGIILIVLTVGAALAAQAEDPGMIERMDTSAKKFMDAINAGSSGKKVKDDPTIESQFKGKEFRGGGSFTQGEKSGEMATFLYDEKFSSQKFETKRSFFGIKNPWIGREIPDAKAAPLMARGILPGDKIFATENVETRSVPGVERDVFSNKGNVQTREYLGKGKSQGAVTQFGGQLTKEMSVEEVREILNKNR